MQTRIAPFKVSPGAYKAMWAVQDHVDNCGLDHILLELVKTRASQMNRCARCVALHTRDARKYGETEERLFLVATWREAPVYTPEERAALAWTEALTHVSTEFESGTLIADLRKYFSELEIVNLTMAIVSINSWNRLNVAFETPFPVLETGGTP